MNSAAGDEMRLIMWSVSGYLFFSFGPKVAIKIKSFEWDGYNSSERILGFV